MKANLSPVRISIKNNSTISLNSYLYDKRKITQKFNPQNVFKIVSNPVLPFRNRYITSASYEGAPYNLYEISSAEDVDGIISRAIQKKRALAIKEGFKLMGENKTTLEYIERRFLELSIAQQYPMELLIKDTIGDLIRFGNAFWYKKRDINNSSGKIRYINVRGGQKKLEPVSAYFRIPPETVRIQRDLKTDQIIAYIQEMPDGRTKEFSPYDIIHWKYNARAGHAFAKPPMWAAIDDIRALRRIEENTEILIEQYLFPLIILTIGTDQWPADVYEDGTTEVDLWANKLKDLQPSGGIAVTHRHKFEILGFDKIIPIEKYLDHFLRRAYTSAGVSNIDMGDGQGMNRSTADTASKIMIEDVKDYQQEFAVQFNFFVINELLLENFSPNVLDPNNIVKLVFNEIDIEGMIKLENHAAIMYNMNVYTEDEARLAAKKLPINDDDIEQRNKMFMLISQKYNPKLPQQQPNQESGAVALSKSKQQPSNQHGQLTGPTGRKSSDETLIVSGLRNILHDFTKNDPDLIKISLLNFLISLDIPKISCNNCDGLINAIAIIDKLIDDAYESLSEDSDLDEQYIIEQLINSIQKLILEK